MMIGQGTDDKDDLDKDNTKNNRRDDNKEYVDSNSTNDDEGK